MPPAKASKHAARAKRWLRRATGFETTDTWGALDTDALGGGEDGAVSV
jgi:hypothetical protein